MPEAQEAQTTEQTPAETGEVDIDAVVQKFEEKQQADAEETDSEGEEVTQTEPEGETEDQQEDKTAEETSSEKEEEPEETPLRAKQLAALSRKEESLKQWEAELKEQQEGIPTAESLRKQFLDEPTKFLESLGLKMAPAELGDHFYAAELGDDAPELKGKLAERRQKNELEALKQELEELKREAKEAPEKAKQTARLEALAKDIQGFTQEIPEEMPFLRKVARKDPQEVLRGMGQIGDAAIAAGNWLSAQQIAQAFEEQLKEQYSWFADEPESERKPAKEGKKESPPETLSDADTRGRARKEEKPEDILNMTPEQIEARAKRAIQRAQNPS